MYYYPFLALFGAFIAFCIIVIGFLIIVFWLWMLIGCLQKKKFEDKLVWVVVLISLNILGAILYYFLVKRKKR